MNFTFRLFFLSALFLFFQNIVSAQTENEKKQYLKYYNFQELQKLKAEFQKNIVSDRERAYRFARENNLETIKTNPDGTFDELIGLLPGGCPLYYSVHNVDAALSTRTNHLNTGGSLNLNLNGEGMMVGVWDGGGVRATHQEFGGRAVIGDNSSEGGNSTHATHVSGTIGAAGIDADAKGMAPVVNLRTYDWNSDIIEVLGEIENGMLLSNHSYGVYVASVTEQPWYIGAYSQAARAWDMVAYYAPYYLMVTSAGNDGNVPNPSPFAPEFDKLNGNKNSKNNLVIANAQDAVVNANGDLISVAINSGSSQGPSDDRRIKPDITGNGTNLYSPTAISNTSYGNLSGTSMSGPNVAGTLALLQQYHNQRNSRFMKAATVKGLACHTADDAGNPGPDARFGWGLLNGKAAANAITSNGLSSWISEEELNQGETFTMTVRSVAGTPLVASITWTDFPGTANTGILNDPTPALVNDLDIRVTQGGNTFYPWKLQSNPALNAVRDGDNNVDNVEVVRIDNPNGGLYTITVSHKNTLVTGLQHFSLVITGITSDFAIVPTGETEKTVCSDGQAVFGFDFFQDGLSSPVTLSAENLPEGAEIAFSSNQLETNGSFTMTVSNLYDAEPGVYNILVTGTNSQETETRTVTLIVYGIEFNDVQTLFPANGQTGVATTTQLAWQDDFNAENYLVEIATDPMFSDIIQIHETSSDNIFVFGLQQETVYYWRVISSNRCGNLDVQTLSYFQTGNVACGIVYTATDYSDAVIHEVPNASATVPVTVPNNFIADKIKVHLDISHTWVQDMTVFLENDSASVILIQEPCGGEDDLLATFYDEGVPLSCGSNPAVSGIIIPVEALANFNNLPASGEWTLRVEDSYSFDGGAVNSFALEFCGVAPIISLLNFNHNTIYAEINSTKIINTAEMNAQTPSQTSSQQVYMLMTMPTLGFLRKDGIIIQVGETFTQEDIALNKISYTNTLSSPATAVFVVNILNASAGWLPNQQINIVIDADMSLTHFGLDEIKVFPNPNKGTFELSLPSVVSGDFGVMLFDLQGRKIWNTTISESRVFDVQNLQDGLYMLTITKDGKSVTKRVVLSK